MSTWQPPAPPKGRLRTRLVVAMVALAIGMLAFTAFATLAIARKANTDNARKELQSKAGQLGGALERYFRVRANGNPMAGTVVRDLLRVSNASLVTVTPAGAVEDGLGGRGVAGPVLRLPQGLRPSDLDVAALTAGRQQTGQRGRNLVFIASPLPAIANGTPVVVATKRVDRALAPGAGGFYILVALGATGIATLVAFLLARRVTGPIGGMQRTARRIAAGDLSARADVNARSNDEMADLARALNAMAAQLEHARGLERGFILSVSHDLRTPLTSIRGYAEALADGTLDEADGRKRAAEIIGAEARRLERLVGDLLDLARLDAHQFSFTPRPVDAGEVVEAAALAFQPAAGGARAKC